MSRLKKLLVSLVACCFLFALTACQNRQDEIYSAYTEPSVPEIQDSAAGSADDADDADEDDPTESPNYIGPPKSELQDLEPIAGDTLSGELTVKTDIYWAEQRGLYFFVKEFMQLHPDVTINIEYDLNFMQNKTLSRVEQRMRRENFYNQVRMELASGEADYLLYDVGGRTESDLPLPERHPDRPAPILGERPGYCRRELLRECPGGLFCGWENDGNPCLLHLWGHLF